MSQGSRIAIGIVALLCAAGFFVTALDPEGLAMGATGFYGMAILFVIIAIACFFPKTHPFTLRMIGTVIFCGYAPSGIRQFPDSKLCTSYYRFCCLGYTFGIFSNYGNLSIMGKSINWFECGKK